MTATLSIDPDVFLHEQLAQASPDLMRELLTTFINALLSAQADAWNRGDLEGFMSAYAHDDALVFTSGGEIHRGWQTTHDRYLDRYRAADARSEMGTLAFEVALGFAGTPARRRVFAFGAAPIR